MSKATHEPKEARKSQILTIREIVKYFLLVYGFDDVPEARSMAIAIAAEVSKLVKKESGK